MAFLTFRHKSNGVVADYPAHYADPGAPFADDLELYDPSEYEEDKVVVGGHDVPVDQRAQIVAKPIDEMTVQELKDALASHGWDTHGNKEELVARLKEYHNQNKDNN